MWTDGGKSLSIILKPSNIQLALYFHSGTVELLALDKYPLLLLCQSIMNHPLFLCNMAAGTPLRGVDELFYSTTAPFLLYSFTFRSCPTDASICTISCKCGAGSSWQGSNGKMEGRESRKRVWLWETLLFFPLSIFLNQNLAVIQSLWFVVN